MEHWKTVKLSKRIVKHTRIAEVVGEDDPRPHVHIAINNIKLFGLLDSGAGISCFGQGAYETLERCGINWKRQNGGGVRTAGGDTQHIEGFADINVTYREESRRIRFYVIPSLTSPLYLGIDFWLAFNLLPKLDSLTEVDPCPEDVMVTPDMHELNKEQRDCLRKVVALFPSSEKEGLGRTSLLKHHIDVNGARPSKQRHYAVSPAIEKMMFEEVDRMLSLGVVEKSSSAWNSPVTVVKKSNGKARLCLDARQVNSITVKDAYPMPKIDSIISRLNETQFISSVDLKDAFWQIELDEESRDKTAFTIPGRPLYQFTRMPFGLCNAAQSMCRLMDLAIPSELRGCVFVYIDDLLVVSESWETHLERLEMVATSLRKANLTINVDKSHFAMKSLKYLGNVIGNGEIKPDPDRVVSITEFPTPKTIKQVRRFLGMTGWYHRYIHGYATLAAPMTDLLKKSDHFCWTPEAQKSFDSLKASLTTAPVLTHPDFSQHFYIQCDASMSGVGGVLFQLVNNEEHPIAYMSRKLNTAQKNYSVTELECLAAVLCVQKFRCYVEGMPFTIITDHASLKWLMGQKELTGRLARWSLKLQGFDFKIEHRKGSENVVPDTLSRMHVDELVATVGSTIDLAGSEFKSDEYEQLKATVRDHQGELPDIEIRDEAVFKRTQFRTGVQTVDSETIWKLWVPETLRQKVISDAHQPTMSAHGGTDKTLDLVRRYYYWPGMSKEVREYVANCATCKETKAPSHTLRPPMGKAFGTERPFQRLYVDLLGPYPRSKARNTTILIILDHLTKFLWLKPLRKASASAIVRILETEVFHLVGAPESVLSDNGVQFTSKEFKALMIQYGVKHIRTASHSPQANASERVNRSILAAIRAYVEKDQSTWDVHLSAISSALRNARHSSTGLSPHFAVFGQHMVQHAGAYTILRELKALGHGDIEIVASEEYRGAINTELQAKIHQAHDRNAKRYNTRAREVNFKPGQEVYIRNFRQSEFAKGFNAKLGPQWLPARIVDRKGECLYNVENRQGKAIRVAYHAKDIQA